MHHFVLLTIALMQQHLNATMRTCKRMKKHKKNIKTITQ